ncbi:endomucin isoform X1 [Ictidomys tridecemlineatus]|uniref:Endomucin n=1 Tax=Ictidomys tridecemlineatus TaxID=43179 RepID=A0A287CUC2_ICTTR|nr:endomucin [Ictidomys tridecemlineatus]KAG3275882.1 endomucin [Ictidomys tridecemlineatus]
MQLLQVTTLFLLFSLCSCEISTGTPTNTSSTTISLPITTVVTTNSTLSTTTDISFHKTTPKGANNNALLNTSPVPATVASSTPVKNEETPTQNVTSSEFISKKGTVTNLPLSNVTSTTQSSQHKTENQSSIKTSEMPDTSPSKTTTVSSTLITSPRYISPQGTEDEKYANPSPTSSSYSSIILPVVIALIVLTLAVFVLVGLYRMFWKTDPGTPENGNDQPQSDKESVKLLTVKTISNESGEHSAQGKSKN